MDAKREPQESDVLAALDEIIRGINVRRSRHDLVLDGRDYTEAFRRRLATQGFVPAAVRDVDLAVDERIPAFRVEAGCATFGHVFWEKFTDVKKRKLFGSVIRDAKGDWAVILGVQSAEPVWIQPSRREKIDPDRPTDL